ncbi:MAG: hypothetical protein Q4P25_05505 [Tissierellia bacterium]|nr:hypothetical protein [Tissierellia bacterium]
MKKNMDSGQYTEVWGDTVVLRELVYACVIGVVLTMGMFFLGQKIFTGREGIEPSLANGYALLVGVGGCILSGIISAKLFKPKRHVEEKFEFEDIAAILNTAGISMEEEGEYLGNSDPEIIKELEDLELYPLLALIPETSKNYKPEYREKVQRGERL